MPVELQCKGDSPVLFDLDARFRFTDGVDVRSLVYRTWPFYLESPTHTSSRTSEGPDQMWSGCRLLCVYHNRSVIASPIVTKPADCLRARAALQVCNRHNPLGRKGARDALLHSCRYCTRQFEVDDPQPLCPSQAGYLRLQMCRRIRNSGRRLGPVPASFISVPRDISPTHCREARTGSEWVARTVLSVQEVPSRRQFRRRWDGWAHGPRCWLHLGRCRCKQSTWRGIKTSRDAHLFRVQVSINYPSNLGSADENVTIESDGHYTHVNGYHSFGLDNQPTHTSERHRMQ